MAQDHIRYDLMAQDALRGVVRKVLADVAKKGLPGDHHFYISFDTHAPGVSISPRLAAQYPDEMTIVLQHQFWDLSVTDERLQVGLSFSGIPERLVVPFASIKGFFDPSVQFGLQFEQVDDRMTAHAELGRREPAAGEAVARDEAKPARKPPELAPVPANPPPPPRPAVEEVEKPTGSAEVVSLDRFRKK
jgi:hypothetical protein